MRNILEDLYFGKITPNEQDITPGSPLQQAMDQAEEYEEKLSALLEGEEKTMLLRLLNAENEIGSTMALENFILAGTPPVTTRRRARLSTGTSWVGLTQRPEPN